MSRSQMEIFGLVIIVILVALGLLFAIVVLTKPSPGVSRVKESVVASNFLNTIMNTDAVGCGDRTVRNLLQDCALSGPNAVVCPNGLTSCEFAERIVEQMLERTLGEWGKEYDFSISGAPYVRDIHIFNSECGGEVEAASRPEKVRASLDMIVMLKLC